MLAAPRPRGTHRLLAGGRRLASPPQIDPEVLEAASRVRKSRGPVGTQVAGSLQFDRATELARTPLREGPLARFLGDARSRVPGRLGHGAVPIDGKSTRLNCSPVA